MNFDYIIKRESMHVWQKLLNQWRKKYDIRIVSHKYWDDGTITIVLERTEKQIKSK